MQEVASPGQCVGIGIGNFGSRLAVRRPFPLAGHAFTANRSSATGAPCDSRVAKMQADPRASRAASCVDCSRRGAGAHPPGNWLFCALQREFRFIL